MRKTLEIIYLIMQGNLNSVTAPLASVKEH